MLLGEWQPSLIKDGLAAPLRFTSGHLPFTQEDLLLAVLVALDVEGQGGGRGGGFGLEVACEGVDWVLRSGAVVQVFVPMVLLRCRL